VAKKGQGDAVQGKQKRSLLGDDSDKRIDRPPKKTLISDKREGPVVLKQAKTSQSENVRGDRME